MRNILRAVLVATLAVAAAGCTTTGGGISLSSLVTPIKNPVGGQQLAAVEATYGVALSGAINYRRLGICPPGTVETLANPCARRPVLLTMQAADLKAQSAIKSLRAYVAAHPTTVVPISVLGDAQKAVASFQAAVPAGAK